MSEATQRARILRVLRSHAAECENSLKNGSHMRREEQQLRGAIAALLEVAREIEHWENGSK